MSKAVRFDEYGGIDVLKVVEVDRPAPQAGQALVLVKAAGINPGEAYIRRAWSRSGGRRRSRPGRAATSPVSWPNSAPASRVSW